MNIIKLNSPNITKGRNGWKPDIISCHITEGSYNGAVGWLLNKESEVSAHFVVSKLGEVTQLVSIEDTAWANGTKTAPDDKRYYGSSNIQAVRERKTSANYYTISIEHEGFNKDAQGMLTPAQLTATAELIKHIRSEVKRIYGFDISIDRQHIIGHCDITPKWKPNCPGQRFPYDEIIKRLKEEKYMVEKKKIQFDGKVYDMDHILHNDSNYIKVQDLNLVDGYKAGYDAARKISVVESPKKA